MKLSEKGKSRINKTIDWAFEEHPDDARNLQSAVKEYLTECDDLEFKPDDFEDTVVLTKEQAKTAQTAVAVIFNDFFDEQSPQQVDLHERLGSLLDTLSEQLKAKEKDIIVATDNTTNITKPMVCLSVEEAKEIKRYLDDLTYQVKLYRSQNHGKAYRMKLSRCRNRFSKRIEQSEKGNANH